MIKEIKKHGINWATIIILLFWIIILILGARHFLLTEPQEPNRTIATQPAE